MHWRGLPPLAATTPLPDGAWALTQFVEAPPALHRRLSHIGVVSKALGQALQPQLKPGQRLVSREGDVWRWDGFTAAADAPSAAAKRLAERNRLASLEVEMTEAIKTSELAKAQFDAARVALDAAVKTERDTREGHRSAVSAIDFTRRALTTHERQVAERLTQTSALDEAQRRIEEALTEARDMFETASAEAAELPVLDTLQSELNELRSAVNRERAAYAEARARHDGLEREAKATHRPDQGHRIRAASSGRARAQACRTSRSMR